MNFKSITHLLFALTIALAALAHPVAADINLVFGTYAADKPTTTVRKYKPFLDHLAGRMSEVLGEPVVIRMRIAKEYEDGIAHLAEGSVDFARFGPASYVTVKDLNPDVQIVAMELKNGQKRFNGIIATHSDSNISSLSDLKGQSFAFGDELSTIGRYLSQSHLIEAGITSHELSYYEFLGRHDLVGTAVASGRFSAGALKESTFKQLVASGEPLKTLFVFENVTKPWLASSSMPSEIFGAMRQAILSIHDSEVLESISKDGFSIGGDEDFDFVRIAMRHSENF